MSNSLDIRPREISPDDPPKLKNETSLITYIDITKISKMQYISARVALSRAWSKKPFAKSATFLLQGVLPTPISGPSIGPLEETDQFLFFFSFIIFPFTSRFAIANIPILFFFFTCIATQLFYIFFLHFFFII